MVVVGRGVAVWVVVAVAAVVVMQARVGSCGWGSVFVDIGKKTSGERCFVEDLPADTLVRARYSLHDHVPDEMMKPPPGGPGIVGERLSGQLLDQVASRFGIPRGISSRRNVTGTGDMVAGLHIVTSAVSPSGRTIPADPLSILGTVDGEFYFTTAEEGEHEICFRVAREKRRAPKDEILRLFVEILTGVDAVNYIDVTYTDDISALQEYVNRANDLVAEIKAEVSLDIDREKSFRATADRARTKLYLWVSLQFVILVACCGWQMIHLRNYFKSRKFF
ncbi:emp24/gp25L/p24 family protein [Pelomyxa schiedti]|nr:emp24/gp25L/p24 family protein [Pelomyxa schiedti]